MVQKNFQFRFTLQNQPEGCRQQPTGPAEVSKAKSKLSGNSFYLVAGVMAGLFLLTIAVVVVLAVVYSQPTATREDSMPRYTSNSTLGLYKKAAVSTDAGLCAPIGRMMLEKDGTAVDAAVAVLICMGAINPHSSGLGGGFLMMVYNRSNQQIEALDAREVAPAAATEDMFHGDATKAVIGGLCIAVPGELSGYYEAHTKYGKLPWKDLFEPTIKLCREGFPVNSHLARALRTVDVEQEPSLSGMFINNATGKVFEEGEILTREDLADTLELIANNGTHKIIYNSNITKTLVEEIRSFGGIITEDDFRNYKAKWLPPITGHLKGNLTVYSVPPPGSGAVLVFILSILNGYGMTPTGHRSNVTTLYHRVIEAFKFAYAKRTQMEDSDSQDMRELLRNLTSPEYAEAVRLQIKDFETHKNLSYYGIKMFQPDNGTAHVSVLDSYGNAVSVTSTVNQYFGSLRRSRSTGIIFNDEMDDFSSPNITNAFGVPPSGKNLIKPGRRPISSMCPSIFVDNNGNVKMVIGGTGGTHITTGVALVSMRALWTRDNIKEAIDAPRIHTQLLPNVVTFEDTFPQEIVEGLRKIGHKMEHLQGRSSIIMGIFREDNGLIYANADYRKGGATGGI